METTYAPEPMQLLTPREAAELLRVSRSWLYTEVREGRLPYVRLADGNGPLRFIQGELLEYVERCHRRPD